MARISSVFVLALFTVAWLSCGGGLVDGAGARRARVSPVVVRVDADRAAHTTDELFLSLGLDSNLIRHRWQNFNFSSVRLQTLARGLSPARVRLMGTDGDRMTLQGPCDSLLRYKPVTMRDVHATLFPDTSFVMTCRDWDNINQFAKKVNWRLMFGLNNQLRKDGVWDPSNAKQILDYSIQQGYAQNLDFELGNEPDLYSAQDFPHTVNGSQLAHDYKTLRNILTSPPYQKYYGNAKLAGPGIATALSTTLLMQFLEGGANTVLDAVTWHQYYGGGEISHVENATDPKILNTYPQELVFIRAVLNQTSRPNLKIWLGETSSAASPVGSNLYETFAATFMLLDKLGQSASLGVDLVVRQTFYGFWFALVDHGIYPTPNYWVSLLFKRLVGWTVLRVAATEDSDHVRLYAHCTAGQEYPAGAVTIYGMNLYDDDVTLEISGNLTNQSEIHQWLLTPYGIYTGLTAKYMAVNGRIILMSADDELPWIPPLVLPAPSNHVRLPAKSAAYYVIPHARAAACLT